MNKYSLVIGRFQPFHEGHKSLIDSLLEEGKKVCVAIMDTEIDEYNPYTLIERTAMIEAEYGTDVAIAVIPPIEEVCYGRNVGYDFRRIHHAKEHITATNIREKKEQPDNNGYTDKEFLLGFNTVAERVHRLAKKQGFWDKGNKRDICEPIAFAHSELSEALECSRFGDPPDKNIKEFSGLEVQLSDCLGILMDMEIGYGLRISEALGHKMKFNETRGYRHGKEF
jgi:cytidyltransferase-like protein